MLLHLGRPRGGPDLQQGCLGEAGPVRYVENHPGGFENPQRDFANKRRNMES